MSAAAARSNAGDGARLACPWYQQCGMRIYEHGAAANIFVPPLLLVARYLAPAQRGAWFAILMLLLVYQKSTTAAAKSRGRKLQPYLHICLPMYFASWPLCVVAEKPLHAITLVLLLVVFKIGMCMSVCLHRYAGHGAFKCGPATNACLCVLGCLANQGGPIWWGSKHRCHHSNCDLERDPHSPLISGVIDAFQFHALDKHKDVDQEFRPSHCDDFVARLIDTLSFVPVTLELSLSFLFGGPVALWVSYVSGWMSQTLALWFNVANHPPHLKTEGHPCASNDSADYIFPPSHVGAMTPNALFAFFSHFTWVAQLTGESAHDHHHDHSSLARRPGVDLPYHLMLLPLEAWGLIWALKRPTKHA
jgi:fatty-acid desaturase